ncbi:S-layer homology domain-containing protein [Planococcus salinarum]|uniref:S-layer homology domain-containing protein n=1 Tax=Planococcus salinarum TaxID=622695 RepID=UPI00163DB78B|nr:S-layer homology domain-containing protein [Planococcus salinarum]
MGKVFQRSLVVAFAVLLMFTAAPQANAAHFSDVTSFKEEIEFLSGLKIINGYPDGTYRPTSPILRVQAVMMIMRDLGLAEGDFPNPGFTDIRPGDMGYEDVAAAHYYGLISGKSATVFDPKGHLTREEMAKILSNAYELGGLYPPGFSDVSNQSWSTPYVYALAANGITNGYPDGTFRPKVTIDRGQFAAFMARILNPDFIPFSPALADTYLEQAFEYQIIDVVKEPGQPVLHLIDGLTNSLVSINYETYETKTAKLPYDAEKLAYANGKVYVTQHKQGHIYYSGDAIQSGAYAIFDAETLDMIKLWNIALDPYDIEADDLGRVYISGGSNQWTSVISYDSNTGAIVSEQGIYMSTLIKLTPDQQRLMAITTTSSPRNVYYYSISEGKLQPGTKWGYHGDYSMTTDIFLTPDGKYMVNGTGNVFSQRALSHVGTLDRQFTSVAVDTVYGELYTANGTNLITAYGYPDLGAMYQMVSYGDIQHMFYDEQSDQLIALTKVKFGKSTYNYMGIEKVIFYVE